MDLYKLHNVGRKNIRLSPGDIISRKKYSIAYLKELADKYEMREFLEYEYCCRGEDHNCWIEVEGIDYGWLWTDKNPEEMPKILFNHALGILKHYRKTLYQRKMFIVENDDRLSIFIFLRDVCKSDFIMTFAKRPEAEDVGWF